MLGVVGSSSSVVVVVVVVVVVPPRIKRVSVIKGVLEARDPHDSQGVEAIRQQLLEDFAGTVFQDRTGGNPPIRSPHGEAVIILKPRPYP